MSYLKSISSRIISSALPAARQNASATNVTANAPVNTATHHPAPIPVSAASMVVSTSAVPNDMPHAIAASLGSCVLMPFDVPIIAPQSLQSVAPAPDLSYSNCVARPVITSKSLRNRHETSRYALSFPLSLPTSVFADAASKQPTGLSSLIGSPRYVSE